MYQARHQARDWVSEKSTVKIAEFSAQWEGRTIEGGLPLRRFLGGSEDRAVYLTTHGGRNAAVKLVAADPAKLARCTEAQKLSHPNLVRILAVGPCEIDGVALQYCVMERAEEDLSQVLPDRSLTAVETREMLGPALSALEYLHRQGFVHAHVKPSNIMAVDDCLKISSDGLVKAGTKHSGPLTPYDPPELANGIASAAGDVWSLGITLSEVLTQRLPANGAVPQGLPEPFATIVRGCLDPNPATRSTIPQISSLLAPAEAPSIPRRKRIAPVGVMVLLALIVIIVAGVIFMHSDTSLPTPGKPVEAAKAPEPQTTPLPAPTPEPKQTATVIPPPPIEKKPEPTPVSEKPVAAQETTPAAPVSGILAQPSPDITDQARETIRGKVKFSLRVDVAPSGAVTDAKVDSAGASKYFADRALAAVRQWKFEPVTVNGSEVGQRWRVRFEFVKNGTKVQPQRLSP